MSGRADIYIWTLGKDKPYYPSYYRGTNATLTFVKTGFHGGEGIFGYLRWISP